MRIELPKEKFTEAVASAERITSKNASLKSLSCILIEFSEKEVVVKATNLDVGVEFRVPAKSSGEGMFLINGTSLRSFLTNSPVSKEVVLEKKENILEIKSGLSEGELVLESSEEFPIIPKVENATEFEILAEELVSGIKSVFWSASMSQIKPELSSVYIYEDKEDLVFVATDSFRLAEKRIKTKKTKNISSVLIPFRNISEVLRIFDGLKGSVAVKTNKNQISFQLGGIYATSRLIDGIFPDYKQIIPKEFSTKAIILKEELSSALRLTGSFADSFNQIEFKVTPSKEKLTIKSSNKGTGVVSEEIKGSFEGEEVQLSFNHKYITEALPSINSSSVSVSLNSQGKPMIIRESSNPSFLYLVMPMNK